MSDVLHAPNSVKSDEPFDLTAALNRAIHGGPKVTDAHLRLLQKDIVVAGTRTTLHCYFLPLDANGRVRVKPLAEFLRDRIVDYAIPRRTIEEAQLQVKNTGSLAPTVQLVERAKELFTDIANTGEGGEILVFAMAEAVFGLAQMICKMSLKTASSVHYHGADGVYVEARSDGGINLYWGESKIFNDAARAIGDCLESLAPFLVEPDGEDAKRERDILLVNENANFTDERLVNGLKEFLDRDDPASLTTKHCGIALAAFDSSAYPAGDTAGTLSAIEAAINIELPKWTKRVDKRIAAEKLAHFDIHFICVPIPSAQAFRDYFLQLLGKASK